MQQSGQALEQQALQAVPGTEQLQNGSEALTAWQDGQVLTAEEQQAELQEAILALAQDHFAEHRSTLRSGQSKLQDLKKKYRQVQTSEEVFVKRNSLEGTPFIQRLTYGATLQLRSRPTLTVDLSPLLGYRLDRDLVVGVGATYRLALSEDRRSIVTDHPVYGGRGFAEYTVMKGFLLHAEYERLMQSARLIGQETSSRIAQSAVLVGIGKNYTITNRVRGTVVFLYNLRSADQLPSLYPRPFMIRFGFRMGSHQ